MASRRREWQGLAGSEFKVFVASLLSGFALGRVVIEFLTAHWALGCQHMNPQNVQADVNNAIQGVIPQAAVPLLTVVQVKGAGEWVRRLAEIQLWNSFNRLFIIVILSPASSGLAFRCIRCAQAGVGRARSWECLDLGAGWRRWQHFAPVTAPHWIGRRQLASEVRQPFVGSPLTDKAALV